jgi:hypothetical protein
MMDGYEFNANDACIRCMPHTVHLSALEVHATFHDHGINKNFSTVVAGIYWRSYKGEKG